MATNVSGVAFLGPIKYLKSEHGEEVLQDVITACAPATQELFSRRILVARWYPYQHFTDFLQAMEKRLGTGDGRFIRQLGEVAGERDIGTLYKIYKALGSAESIIRVCGRLWESYYREAGQMEAVSTDPDDTVIRITGFDEMHPLHCKLVAGWITASIRAIGFDITRTTVETACPSRGDPHHEFTFAWNPERRRESEPS